MQIFTAPLKFIIHLNFKSNNNLEALFISIVELLATFTLLFVPCELFGQLSSKFDDINDRINRFNWYLFPLEMQRMLPLIMINAQQPVDFGCFGSFACNRDTFKKVNKRTYELLRNIVILQNHVHVSET